MEEKYFKEFQKMGISINFLPENYDPDVFGRMLFNNSMMLDVELNFSDETQVIKNEKEYA